MDERTRKRFFVGLTVGCFSTAALITLANSWDRGGGPPKGQTWMLCRNPRCTAGYQLSFRDYYDRLEKNWDGRSLAAPALKCRGCREMSAYVAVKCVKCELVFEPGSVARDFEDRCPKCGYSEQDEYRKRAMGLDFK
jgi:hypothetical protein